jgi:hypothetical protein
MAKAGFLAWTVGLEPECWKWIGISLKELIATYVPVTTDFTVAGQRRTRTGLSLFSPKGTPLPFNVAVARRLP